MATNIIYGPEAHRQIVETYNRVKHEIAALRQENKRLRQLSIGVTYYVGKANGTITAISGDTLGEGQVDIYRPDGTDIGTMVQTLDVLNAAGEVPDGRVVGITKGAWGNWYVTVEACPT